MNNDLISREALKNAFSDMFRKDYEKWIKEIIDNAPTVEQPTGECRTCRHRQELGYKGCRNCKHQIEPLRMCEWAERGGDGKIHIICPMWNKKEAGKKE